MGNSSIATTIHHPMCKNVVPVHARLQSPGKFFPAGIGQRQEKHRAAGKHLPFGPPAIHGHRSGHHSNFAAANGLPALGHDQSGGSRATRVRLQLIEQSQSQAGINAGDPVVGHNAKPIGEPFQLSGGWRFPDVEQTNQNKSCDT